MTIALKKVAMVISGVMVAAVLLALAAPKAVHAIVSTLVTVANTAANPVITQSGDNHARTSVALNCAAVGNLGGQEANCSFGTGKSAAGTFQVPEGQRFVVEYVTGEVTVPLGSTLSQLLVTGYYSGSSTTYFPFQYLNFVPTQIGSDSRQNYYTFSSPITAYIDADYSLTGICSLAVPTNQGGISCNFALFGHLENIN